MKRLDYNPTEKILRLLFEDTPIHETNPHAPNVLVDTDSDGNIVAIEVLDVPNDAMRKSLVDIVNTHWVIHRIAARERAKEEIRNLLAAVYGKKEPQADTAYVYLIFAANGEYDHIVGIFDTEEEARAVFDKIPTDTPPEDPDLRQHFWFTKSDGTHYVTDYSVSIYKVRKGTVIKKYDPDYQQLIENKIIYDPHSDDDD